MIEEFLINWEDLWETYGNLAFAGQLKLFSKFFFINN